jgi:hypothetical protein
MKVSLWPCCLLAMLLESNAFVKAFMTSDRRQGRLWISLFSGLTDHFRPLVSRQKSGVTARSGSGAAEDQNLRLNRQRLLAHDQIRCRAEFDGPFALHAIQKSGQGELVEIVHRDDQPGAQRFHHVDHTGDVEGIAAVNGHQHDIKLADDCQLFGRQGAIWKMKIELP